MAELEVRDLCKAFGKIRAVDGVSFDVPEGAVFGIIGRNGAGKTTTIRILMDIYEPDSGEVLFRGARAGRDFRDRVGYLPEERGLYKKMKVWDTLMYFAEIKGKTGRPVAKKAVEYLRRFQLEDRRASKIEDLSKGNQQKVQFIATVLHDPDFLVLDEPFSGLDPINTNLLKEIVLEFKREGKVILFSTHLMDFAEKMCDSIAMIDGGKLILNGALKDIKARYGARNVSVSYEGDISFLKGHPLVEHLEDFGNNAGVRLKEAGKSQDLLRLLVDREIRVRRFNAEEISLQEIFIEMAGREEGLESEVGHA